MKIIDGDITTVTSGYIAQQVNAQGVMNSGVAKALRAKYPQVWEDYHSLIYQPVPHSAQFMGQVIYTHIDKDLTVASIVGQQYYGRETIKYTSYDALDLGFSKLGEAARKTERAIAVPLIGCGLGGGDWNVVQEIIKHRTKGVEVTLWLQNV